MQDFASTYRDALIDSSIWNFLRLGVKTLSLLSYHIVIDLTCVAYLHVLRMKLHNFFFGKRNSIILNIAILHKCN